MKRGDFLNRLILHVEGFLVLILSIYFYVQSGFHFGYFLLFLLVPDLSMAGYALNTKVGAGTYNTVHSYILPGLLLAAAIHFDDDVMLATSLIWTAHIGMDRMIGYGLKYPSKFKDTHMQRM